MGEKKREEGKRVCGFSLLLSYNVICSSLCRVWDGGYFLSAGPSTKLFSSSSIILTLQNKCYSEPGTSLGSPFLTTALSTLSHQSKLLHLLPKCREVTKNLSDIPRLN